MDILRLRDVYVVYVCDDVVDELFALLDQRVVQLVALDKEHAHANFIRSLSLDLPDSFKVDLDASNVLTLLAVLLLAENLDFLRLLQKE